MKFTTTARLVLFGMITVVAMLFFFFEPALNIGAKPAISIYQELKQGQPLMYILTKLAILSGAIFFGLVFLIGLEGKSKTENTNKK